jgi:hypothetical protein
MQFGTTAGLRGECRVAVPAHYRNAVFPFSVNNMDVATTAAFDGCLPETGK